MCDFMNIVFIGAGRLATNLAKELYKEKYNITQIYSRTIESAASLATKVNAVPINNITEVRQDADLYIFAIKDSVLPELIKDIPQNKGLWIHTSGSVPLNIFSEYTNRYGVLYPLQTFSKEREVNFKTIPLFYEASNNSDLSILKEICDKISNITYELSSEKRKYIHLSGVFACNFVNHMYSIAEKILTDNNLPFEILLPLIDETASKVHSLLPDEAQTGPAIRYDRDIINKHITLIDDLKLKSIYASISESIYTENKNE